MFSKSCRFGVIFVALATLFGGGCPPQTLVPTETILLSSTNTQIELALGAPIPPNEGGCATATEGFETTFVTTAPDVVVTVSVTGPATASRPQIRVSEAFADFTTQVALTTENNEQSNSTSFTSSAASVYLLEVNECTDPNVSGTYTVSVIQAATLAPEPGSAYTLRNTVHSLLDPPQVPITPANQGCGGAVNGFGTAIATIWANQPVMVTVTGPTSNSRPQIGIGTTFDGLIVVTSDNNSQTQTVTFTPAASDVFLIGVNECAGAAVSGNYAVLVTQTVATLPSPGDATHLRASTHADAGGPSPISITDGGCPTASGGFETTFVTAAVGKQITATVTGPTAESRPQIRVRHHLTSLATNDTFDAQSNSITFESAGITYLTVQVNECAVAAITGDYAVSVDQAP